MQNGVKLVIFRKNIAPILTARGHLPHEGTQGQCGIVNKYLTNFNEQAVNKKAQVTRHHDIPIKYGGRLGSRWVNWILKSSTPVVYITNIDYMKITLGAAFAKQSGIEQEIFS